MYIYKHITIHQTILYRIIRDYKQLKIHKNYHSWTRYDNKKCSVIFSKWKPNAIEITYYMYLQCTLNWHPESGHKWLGSIPTYKRPRPRVTAHATELHLIPFPQPHDTCITSKAAPSGAENMWRKPISRQHAPCADDCAPWCMFRADDVGGILKLNIWTASSEFGTYRLCEQRRFRRACASAQSRQNLRCSLIQAVNQEEPSDREPYPWPLWMAGHAQLKSVMTECSKTQIRLTGLIYTYI